jgi:hypothetical protein
MVLSAPTAPTLTVLAGVVPANPLYVTPPTAALLVLTAAAVTLPLPNATAFPLDAVALAPIAIEESPLALAEAPWATEFVPDAAAAVPMATPLVALAVAFNPICNHCAPPTMNPLGA